MRTSWLRGFVVKRFFNLIEVTLAIAVVGIGMVSIMSLFPVGINAIRQSVAENYASDAGDLLMTYLMRNCNDTSIYSGTKDFWDYYIYDDKGTPTNYADDAQGIFNEGAAFWGNAWNSSDPANNTTVRTAEATLTSAMTDIDVTQKAALYQSSAPATYPGLFKITQGSALVSDFTGIARIWKSQVTGIYIYEQNLDILYPYAYRLYIEISWPAQKPYSKRDKKTFCVEIFRQKF